MIKTIEEISKGWYSQSPKGGMVYPEFDEADDSFWRHSSLDIGLYL